MNGWIAALVAGLCAGAALLGEPAFRVYSIPLGAPALRLVVAPLDAGPTPDAAVLLRTDVDEVGLLTLRGSGSGRLTQVDLQALRQSGYVNTPTLAPDELNGDALLDFGIAAIPSGQVFLGDGDLTYTGMGFLPTAGGSQHGLDFTDVDGDGDLDSVLLVDDIGEWWLDVGINSGAGSFGGVNFSSAPGIPAQEAQLLFADVDNDGRDATFVVGGTGLATSAWPGGLPSNDLLLAGSLGEVLAADFDADGYLDLAVASPDAGGAFVLANDGAGGFPTAVFFPSGSRPRSLAAGDVTGNGHTDLAVANRGDGTVALLEGDGAGGFTRLSALTVAARPVDVEVADLDADGDLDLVVASDSPHLTVALNQRLP